MDKIYEFSGLTKNKALLKAEKELNLDRKYLEIIEESRIDKFIYNILDEERITIKVRKLNKKLVDKKEQNINYLKIINKYFKEVKLETEIKAFEYMINLKSDKIVIDISAKEQEKLTEELKYKIEEELSLKFLNNNCETVIYANIRKYEKYNKKQLIKIANAAKEEAYRENKEICLNPMGSYERKIIHAYLRKANVKTKSRGKEPERYLVVYPQNKE